MPSDPIYNLPAQVAADASQLLSDNAVPIVALVVAFVIVWLVAGFLRSGMRGQ